MLLEDKEFKKSISLQLNRVRGRAFAKRSEKINSKNHEIFQSSKAITLGYGSKITLQSKTLGLHFQMSDPTFFLSL